MMFCRKSEQKKHSACAILIIGALATIGAISITRSGKQMMSNVMCKVKGMFKGSENNSVCPID